MAIGDIGVSRREIQTQTPTVRPEQFGAGVGQALHSLGETAERGLLVKEGVKDAEANLANAYADRTDRLDLANARVALIKAEAEFSREQAEFKTQAAAGAPGFTDNSKELIEKRIAAFTKDLSPAVKEKLGDDLARWQETVVNDAFSFELTAQSAQFNSNVLDLQQTVVNEIMTAQPDDIDDIEAGWMAQMEKLFADSPLTAAETQVLQKQALELVKRAKLAREGQEEALNNLNVEGTVPGRLETKGRIVRSDGPVAAGLPAVAVGLLNGISRKEVTNGAYNQMFSPGHPRYFDDFSWHPNDPAEIVHGEHAGEQSSAAGRYQFLIGTWERAARALGLTDFSPESQDRAAWWLAKEDYRAKTGRDLELDLRTGDPSVIAQVRRHLSSTWEGLKHISDGDFLRAVTGGTAHPSALMYDEQYSNIPFSDRLSILQDAQKNALNIMQAQFDEQQSQLLAGVESMKANILQGTGRAELDAFYENNSGLSVKQIEDLETMFAEKNEQRINAQGFASDVSNPAYIFDSDAASKRKYLDFFQESGFGEALAEQDAEYMNQTLLPTVQKTGYMHPALGRMISQQISSQDLNRSRFALTLAGMLLAEAPESFNAAFSADVQNQVVAFDMLKDSLPPEQLNEMLRFQNDPKFKTTIENARREVSELRKNDPESFSGRRVAKKLGSNNVLDSVQVGALEEDYHRLYSQLYPMIQNPSKADDAVLKILNTRYGAFSMDDTEFFMKYPPNKVGYPTYQGSYNYITEQVRENFLVPEGAEIRLINDAQTQAEAAAGELPSYKVAFVEDGFFYRFARFEDRNVTTSERIEWADPMAQARVRPEVTEEMRTAQAEEVYQEQLRRSRAEEDRRKLDSQAEEAMTEIQEVQGKIDELARVKKRTPEQDREVNQLFELKRELESNALNLKLGTPHVLREDN